MRRVRSVVPSITPPVQLGVGAVALTRWHLQDSQSLLRAVSAPKGYWQLHSSGFSVPPWRAAFAIPLAPWVVPVSFLVLLRYQECRSAFPAVGEETELFSLLQIPHQVTLTPTPQLQEACQKPRQTRELTQKWWFSARHACARPMPAGRDRALSPAVHGAVSRTIRSVGGRNVGPSLHKVFLLSTTFI